MREVANLLIMEDKSVLLEESLRKSIFPSLSPIQIKTIALNFHPDTYFYLFYFSFSIQKNSLPESVLIGLNGIIGILKTWEPKERIPIETLMKK